MKADAGLVEAWRERPDEQVSVIIHVDGPADQHVGALEALGICVVRAFRLTNTIAVRATAGCVLGLFDRPWVQRIELDQAITTFR